MSAEILRQAATLMRERADAARPLPWIQNGRNGIHTVVGQCIATTVAHDDDRRKAEAQHIASWHPTAALAVAEWLDACADYLELDPDYTHDGEDYALNVARAYLGSES